MSINIFTDEFTDKFIDVEKFSWWLMGMNNNKDVKLEDYEKMLRPVFGDVLSVKK